MGLHTSSDYVPSLGRIHAGDPRYRAGQNMHIGTTTERIVCEDQPAGLYPGNLGWRIDAIEIQIAQGIPSVVSSLLL